MIRPLLIVPFLLGLVASVSSGQVHVVSQLGNVEVIAGSDCPEDPPREPDWGKGYTLDLADYFADVTAAMVSACGEAAMHGVLDVSIGGSVIAGVLEAETSLTDHGGGHASNSVQLAMSVTSPAHYVLVAQGSTIESEDDNGRSGILLSFAAHDTFGADDFDVRWEGTLSPGFYSLQVGAGGQRTARSLPGGHYVFESGQTSLRVTFELTFTDASVVAVSTSSFGALKARF